MVNAACTPPFSGPAQRSVMPASATPSLIARLTRRRPRTQRQPEPADMGTAFGMEQWLDERDHGGSGARVTASVRRSWLPRWLQTAAVR